MRHFALTLVLAHVLAVTASVLPVTRQVETETLVNGISTSIEQAVYITQNLNSEIKSIQARVESDPLLYLHPFNYDAPGEILSAFERAQSGIENLPTITPDTDIPDYIAEHYGPLVNTIAETLFFTLSDLKYITIDASGNLLLQAILNGSDTAIYQYVMAMNSKFQGFTCALAKETGTDNPAGQAIRVVSDQTFALLLDGIATGQC